MSAEEAILCIVFILRMLLQYLVINLVSTACEILIYQATLHHIVPVALEVAPGGQVRLARCCCNLLVQLVFALEFARMIQAVKSLGAEPGGLRAEDLGSQNMKPSCLGVL